MRKPKRLASLVLLAVLSAAPCFSQQIYKFTLPAKDEPIYGTWVNTAYSGWGRSNAQKYVFLGWGSGRIYDNATDDSPSYELTFILVEKWVDAGSHTWYRAYLQSTDTNSYLLCRVSGDRKTLEFVRGAGFPEESDLQPASSMYKIFHRQ